MVKNLVDLNNYKIIKNVMSSIKSLPFEKFKVIEFHHSSKLKYAISNKGRLISFKNEISDGRIINGSKINGYKIFRYKIYVENKILNKHAMFSKLVAENFLHKTSENQRFVLHKDYDKTNNESDNLFYATDNECVEHGLKSPLWLKARSIPPEKKKQPNAKLTVSKVKMIKKLINSKKNRQVIIAKQFGVSATQIKRIQRGENWINV